MNTDFRFGFFPPKASEYASHVDLLYFALCAIALFFTVLIFLLVFVFGIRYRRKSHHPPPPTQTYRWLELAWSIIPLGIVMAIFLWSTFLYYRLYDVPADAMDVYVVGKQWMWKVQHPNGVREINEFHVPTGRPIRLILGSQDVIHSFFVPAFRIKQDAVPGRYTSLWFTATTPGVYHLFCAEYCGTQHSHMVGRVVVQSPADYQAWLAGVTPEETPAVQGYRLFQSLGCAQCHGQQAPTMAGLYLSRVKLDDGSTVTADDNYLRTSILDSTAQIVAGYKPLMPSFRRQITEEQINALVAYIKSVKDTPIGPQPAGPALPPPGGYPPDRPMAPEGERR